MYSRSVAMLKQSKNALLCVSEDDAYLDVACFETQQAVEFDKKEALDILSDTITDWEEGSRYGKGVRTTVQTVQRVHNIYKSLNDAFLNTQDRNQKDP
jgi:hypothetical protein